MQPKESTNDSHFVSSMVKSFFRLLAGIVLLFGHMEAAGLLIVIAELFGIKEEL